MLRQRCWSVAVSVTSAPQSPPKPDCGQAVQPAALSVRWITRAYALSGVPVTAARNGAVPVNLQTV